MDKILTVKNLGKEIEIIKSQNKKIILVGGCFDILHAGHIEFLEKSKKLGDNLIILLENDKAIKKLKGYNKPINKQGDRALILSKLNMVDYIVPLPFLKNDKDYQRLVEKIKPDIIAITEKDNKKKQKNLQAKLIGGKLIEVMKRKKNYSTTKILEKLNS